MPGVFSYTASTNIVVVTGGTSGSPADFASFVAADRAGTLTLLNAGVIDASPDTFSLTTAIRPVEKKVIKITISTSADRAGATANIAGTDGDGDAISEGIDIATAHSTPVTTVLKYAAVNASGLTITGMTNGDTVTVTQPQWGVIWNLGNSQYQVDALVFDIGNGSTSTYFLSTKEQIFLNSDLSFNIKANATCTVGVKSTAYGISGSHFSFKYTGALGGRYCTWAGTLKIYGSIFSSSVGSGYFWKCQNASSEIYDSTFEGMYNLQIEASVSWYRSYIKKSTNDALMQQVSNSTLTGPYIIDSGSKSISWGGGADWILKNALVQGGTGVLINVALNKTASLIDSPGVITAVAWGPSTDGQIQEKYTINIHLADKDGVNLGGATVLCEDKNSTTAFSVSTDAGGDIAEQTIIANEWADGATVATTFTPHKFTISKAGYQTLVLDNITVDHPIVWHLELQPTYPVVGSALFDVDGNPYIFLSNPMILKV